MARKLTPNMRRVLAVLDELGDTCIYPREGGYWLPESIANRLGKAAEQVWFEMAHETFGCHVDTRTINGLVDRGYLTTFRHSPYDGVSRKIVKRTGLEIMKPRTWYRGCAIVAPDKATILGRVSHFSGGISSPHTGLLVLEDIELWHDAMEQGVRETGDTLDLCDQTVPFTFWELWFDQNEDCRWAMEYLGCWLEARSSTLDITEDGCQRGSANMLYILRKPDGINVVLKDLVASPVLSMYTLPRAQFESMVLPVIKEGSHARC